ncbi:hypothetical protein RND81_09G151400 [Saponaria officinalis]|uniref:S-protein homolog n=1 Tax=Saponaria officinalis TaxID=3572 RepID=A0AAW1IKY1_SAPOF
MCHFESKLHNHIITILLCLLLLHAKFIPTLSQYQFRKYTVRIVSHTVTAPIKVRCQSKDDDLGTRVLQFGEEFTWSFRVNVLMNTLYFCHFYLKECEKSLNVFEVFSMGYMCDDEYNWVVTELGIYKGCEGETPQLVTGW